MAKWVGGSVPYQVHVIPIGLMYVATAARDTGAADVRVVESSLDCPTDRDYIALLEEFRPDVVGIRCILFFLEELQRIARLTRATAPATIVVGGPIVQALRQDLFHRVPEADLAFKGESERSFAAWLSGRSVHELGGVLRRDHDVVVENPDSPEIDDLDSIARPAYDLVDLSRYEQQLSYAYNHRRQGVLVTGRGCPFTCTFCFQQRDRLRLRSAAHVVSEIQHLFEDHGVRDFYIVDDIFNVSAARAFEIFDRIIATGMRLRLYFANGLRPDVMTEALVDRAIEAGAIWFTYAVETACHEIQALIRKHVDLERARRIIAHTQRQDVAVNVTTMYGFPTEGWAEAQRTLDWLGELPRPPLVPYHFCLRFFPGCEIRQQALAAGWTLDQLDASTACAYHDLPVGTPTLSRAEMMSIAVQYHERFGLSNRAAVRQAVRTLTAVGYSEAEILHMYTVLMRRPLGTVADLIES